MSPCLMPAVVLCKDLAAANALLRDQGAAAAAANANLEFLRERCARLEAQLAAAEAAAEPQQHHLGEFEVSCAWPTEQIKQ